MINEALITMALSASEPFIYTPSTRIDNSHFWKWKMQARTHNGHRKHGHKKQRGTRK
jgi:hypothetical protein